MIKADNTQKRCFVACDEQTKKDGRCSCLTNANQSLQLQQTGVVRSASTKKCWNCKHRTQAFKVGKLTHYHCMSPTYEKQHKEGVAISPWETLRVFSDSCDEHEFRS